MVGEPLGLHIFRNAVTYAEQHSENGTLVT